MNMLPLEDPRLTKWGAWIGISIIVSQLFMDYLVPGNSYSLLELAGQSLGQVSWTENGSLMLLVFGGVVVLLLLLLSFLSNPGSWFLLLVGCAFCGLVAWKAFDSLNVLFDRSIPKKMTGQVVSIETHGKTRYAKPIITMDVDVSLPSTQRYHSTYWPHLFRTAKDKDRVRVEFYRCEGYFHRPYVCTLR